MDFATSSSRPVTEAGMTEESQVIRRAKCSASERLRS
jgi:hypothetical protein